MNEQIQKLWQQANIRHSVWETLKPRDERKSIPDIFAELIVRDCATKANATALDLRIHPELDARKYVGDGILKCFGVEE
jgi:hypothetical protein